MKTRKKRVLRTTLIVLLSLAALAGASLIPTLWLKTAGMRELRGGWVNVYYEREEDAAREVFALAEARAGELSEKLGFTERYDIGVYIYDSQFTFQTKKYGLIAPLLGLDWYIGDNKGTNVLLTSPANPGTAHSREDVTDAALHEMAHAYNYVIDPDMPLWLSEGVALYLSNGDPREDLCNVMPIPSLKDIQTSSPVEFANMGGYDFAYTYLEYLDKIYKWDKVLWLMRTGSYEDAFGVSARDAHAGWTEWLRENYS